MSLLICPLRQCCHNWNLLHFLGRQPWHTLRLNWGNHLGDSFSLYFSADPWVWWEQWRCNTLEGVISRSGRGQLGMLPDSRPTPHVSIHLRQTADPKQPESLTRWQRRWSVVESLPHVTIYLTNTAHTPKATILRQPWLLPASCQSGEGGMPPTDFSFFFSGVKNEEIHALFVNVPSFLDLLLYSVIVQEVFRKGTMYLGSALSRTPNCLLGSFHRICCGATNPVLYICYLSWCNYQFW